MTIVVEDVNDNAPTFVLNVYNFSVLTKATKNDYFVGIVEAFDLDEGINKKITYYTFSPYISVYPETGEVFLSQNLSHLPYEKIEAEIFAIDYGAPAKVGSTQLNIYLIDEYLNPPVFDRNEYLFVIETPMNSVASFGAIKVKDANHRVIATK